MRFGCKMNYSVKIVLSEEIQNGLFFNYISFFKPVVLFFFYIRKVLKITGICKLVGINNKIFRIFADKSSDNM